MIQSDGNDVFPLHGFSPFLVEPFDHRPDGRMAGDRR
jgi:hypothetical protein